MTQNENTLRVVEIFYSIQGEGAMQGKPSIFIRLAGCNLQCEFCDTNHGIYKTMSISEILADIKRIGLCCRYVIWTGGEPCLQLTDEIVDFFNQQGYTQAIETNGTQKVPQGISYVAVSPKRARLHPWFSENHIHEMRLLFPFVVFSDFCLYDYWVDRVYLSPIFEGEDKRVLNHAVLMETIEYCKQNPGYFLSVQSHKLCGFE